MNQEDFALVVGISRYPGLGDSPEEANLQAPDRDARMVYDWLISEDGGAVPPNNIDLILSSQFSPPATSVIDAEPTQSTIERCFKKYVVRDANSGSRVGRRLYLYLSGHGFSPKRAEGGLFTADATKIWTEHIYATAWIEWFQDTGYFEELVLWMDCCMDREFTVIPQFPPVRQQGIFTPPQGSFIALAARRPLRTVERKISEDGEIHGVFTWALLKGLKGAAAERDGTITGQSLGNYLRNAMKDFLDPKDLDNRDIDKEPDIVKGDPSLIFKSPIASFAADVAIVIDAPQSVDIRGSDLEPVAKGIVAHSTYVVKLSFPAETIGKLARLWVGTEIIEIEISANEIELNLERGLYAIEVPAANLRQGFEVTGSGEIALSIVESGESIIAPAPETPAFTIAIDTGDPTAEIFIIDRFFALVARGVSSLRVNQPFGIYKIKIRIGRDTTEKIILLDRERPSLDLQLPKLASAAPLFDTALIHEYHEAAAREIDRHTDIKVGSGGQLSLMVRGWNYTDRERSTLPWQGIEIIAPTTEVEVIADLEVNGRRDERNDPFVICNIELDPGTYYLRRRLAEDRVVEQSAIVVPGWRTELYLLRSAGVRELESFDKNRLSVFMRRIGGNYPNDYRQERDRTIDAARLALTDERHILTEEIKQMFLDKCDNPISGIIGSHLLLMEYDKAGSSERQPNLQLLDIAVRNLRAIVGNKHPDVEALSLRCLDPNLRTQHSFDSPPMFVLSWQLMIAASERDPHLIPLKLWDKVRANVDFSSYFAWASDRGSRKFNKQQLAAWIESLHRGSPLEIPAADSDTRGGTPERGSVQLSDIKARLFDRPSGLRVPANALDKLWRERASRSVDS